MPPTAEFSTMPPNTLRPSTCLRANQARSAVVVTWFLSTSPSKPRSLYRIAISSSSRERPNTSGAACTCVVHEPGDRAHRRGRGREHADLPEHLARIENRREPRGADDGDAGLEKVAPRCVVTCGVAGIGAAEVNRAWRMGPAAAVGEFPSGQIGPK